MIKHLAFALVLTLLSFAGFSQIEKDAISWIGVSISKKVTKDLELSLMEQGRFSNNISHLKHIFTDISLGYKLNKALKFSAACRYSNRQLLEGGFETAYRYNFDIQVRYKKKPFVLSYRNRFQVENVVETNGMERDPYDRNRIKVALDLDKKYSPWIAMDIYYSINKEEFNKRRYTLGVEFNLPNRNELALFYRFVNTFNVSNPSNSYIIGVFFHHNLKGRLIKKKKKKKEGQ